MIKKKWFVVAAFALGYSLSASDRVLQPMFLMSLHTHSSFSEGSGTMYNHLDQARQANFDGILWTDHMIRQQYRYYVHAVNFDNDLFADPIRPVMSSTAWFVEDAPENFWISKFNTNQFTQGAASYELSVGISPTPSAWQEGSFGYFSEGRKERISLYAQPHVRLMMNLRYLEGACSIVARVNLSSTPDGSYDGTPRVIEFVPEGMQVPPPEANVRRVAMPALPLNSWVPIDLDIAAAALQEYGHTIDLGFRTVEFIIYRRNGGRLKVLFDDFKIELDGKTDFELYEVQKQVGAQLAIPEVEQYFGAEVEGPMDQAISAYSSRDHVVTMFENGIQGLITFPDGGVNANNYPQSAISWAQQNDGIAILAHLFSAMRPTEEMVVSDANYVAARVVAKQAWGADAIEIGYTMRGRSLQDFITVWDKLSESKVYITGVGVTDDHTVEPWAVRVNRMGSWLIADDNSGASLCDSIRKGEVFFGDPFVFDPNGRVAFSELNNDFRMGDVVQTSAQEWYDIRMFVDGARSGDNLVMLKNGVEAARYTFSNDQLDVTESVRVSPGDWLRLEVRDPAEQPIVLSNPIYFIDNSQTPPVNRRP